MKCERCGEEIVDGSMDGASWMYESSYRSQTPFHHNPRPNRLTCYEIAMMFEADGQ